MRRIVERQLLAGNVRVAMELLLPKLVADHDRGRSGFAEIILQKPPPERRLDAESGEQTLRDVLAVEGLNSVHTGQIGRGMEPGAANGFEYAV